jgi:hypothetical protein
MDPHEHAGDGRSIELEGDLWRAEGVDGELDASIGPGTNGEGNEIQRGEVKLKEETEEREEVCSVVAMLRTRRRSLGQCWEGLDGGGELGMAP